VYQYFPDKQAIYAALHERHIADVDRAVGRVLTEHAGSALKTVVCALFDAMVALHSGDAESLALLMTEVPHHGKGTQQFADRIQGALHVIVSSRANEVVASQTPAFVFVLANMLEALSHATVLRRPPAISFELAREQAGRALIAWIDLHSGQ
jgi:AcrR family transcriptional regulator